LALLRISLVGLDEFDWIEEYGIGWDCYRTGLVELGLDRIELVFKEPGFFIIGQE